VLYIFLFICVCFSLLKRQKHKNGDYKSYFSVASTFFLPWFLKQDFLKIPGQNQTPDLAFFFFFFYDLLIFFLTYLPDHALALFELHAPVAVAAIRAVAHINGTMCRTFLEILISLRLLTSASVLSVHVSSLSFTSAQNHFPCHLTGI